MKKKKTRKERLKKAFVKIIDENTIYTEDILACSYEELADKLVAKIIKKGMLKGEKNMRPT